MYTQYLASDDFIQFLYPRLRTIDLVYGSPCRFTESITFRQLVRTD